MKNRTLLVDSSYLLKRSFFGAKDATTSKFGSIGGLYSFLTTLRKLIKEHRINKVVLMWDGDNGGMKRYLIDPAYKANRKDKSWSGPIELTDAQILKENEKKESVLKQKKRIQAYAEELFLRQIEAYGIEADDLIAAYCQEHHEDEDIMIFTNDRDYAQLLHLNITILFGNIDKPINKNNYYFYFGYVYSNALTMKIICGDTSDNIEGIKGIKEQTLLKYFPDIKYKKKTVREICKEADDINKQRIIEKKKPLKALDNLINNIDRLKKNFELVNLSSPLLSEDAINELEQLNMPLSPVNRGSKNLYKMMVEDEFLLVYSGNFVDYVEPFYSVIMNEKKIYKEFLKNNKKNS